jgi:hypothetical protein
VGQQKICDASSTAPEVVNVASRKKSVAIPAEDATMLRCSPPTLYPTDASRSYPAPAGGYTRETAIAAAKETGELVAFARRYIANVSFCTHGGSTETCFKPDFRYRLLHGIALTVGERARYYGPGSVDPHGYTDYPFAAPVGKAQA